MKDATTHGSNRTITCPNCGFAADHNYCAQCGQETHLHKETFWGLVVHFIGHYFHYDSKFWKTMKALWFSPGKLSRDYWDGRRARYIPPVSLYIFISAVYFISLFSIHKTHAPTRVSARSALSGLRQTLDKMDGDEGRDTFRVGGTTIFLSKDSADSENYFIKRTRNLKTPEARKAVAESLQHNFPKIFFFMIPATGMLLKISFLRRKALYFVHHAIFSLHIHSFFFSALLIIVLNPFYQIDHWLSLICLAGCLAYFVIALRKAYNVGWGRAIRAAVFVGMGYSVFYMVAWIAMAAFVIYSV